MRQIEECAVFQIIKNEGLEMVNLDEIFNSTIYKLCFKRRRTCFSKSGPTGPRAIENPPSAEVPIPAIYRRTLNIII